MKKRKKPSRSARYARRNAERRAELRTFALKELKEILKAAYAHRPDLQMTALRKRIELILGAVVQYCGDQGHFQALPVEKRHAIEDPAFRGLRILSKSDHLEVYREISVQVMPGVLTGYRISFPTFSSHNSDQEMLLRFWIALSAIDDLRQVKRCAWKDCRQYFIQRILKNSAQCFCSDKCRFDHHNYNKKLNS